MAFSPPWDGLPSSPASRSRTASVRSIYFRLDRAADDRDQGYFSLPVVGLTAIFTRKWCWRCRAILASPASSADLAVATVVVLSITREVGPVLAGLMVAGQIGAAMAAEIGTMRVTEQVDALSTLSTSPYKYLVAPRLLAGTLMLPCLVLVGDIIGVFGGFLVSVYKLRIQSRRSILKGKLGQPQDHRRHFGPDQGSRVRLHDCVAGLL